MTLRIMVRSRRARLRWTVACVGSLLVVHPGLAAAQDQQPGRYEGSRLDGRTEVEKAIGGCVAAVAVGAIAGALIGGKSNRGRGALIGAGAGGLLCAAMLSVASKRDKEELRRLQLEALNSGQPQSQEWLTSDNKAASALVHASDVIEVTTPKTSESLKCRRVSTTLRVDQQSSDTSDVVCLQGDSWLTLEKLKSTGLRAQDVAV